MTNGCDTSESVTIHPIQITRQVDLGERAAENDFGTVRRHCAERLQLQTCFPASPSTRLPLARAACHYSKSGDYHGGDSFIGSRDIYCVAASRIVAADLDAYDAPPAYVP